MILRKKINNDLSLYLNGAKIEKNLDILKILISKVQKTHHRTLQVVYETYKKSCKDLLLMNDDYQKHLHFLATKLLKSFNNLNPQFTWNYFTFKPIPYDLKKENVMHLSPISSTRDQLSFILQKFYGIFFSVRLRKATLQKF